MTPSPGLLPTAVHMILALMAILGVLGLLLFITRRFMGRVPGRSSDAPVRVLSTSYIGVKKSIALVEVPGAILILGLTSDRMVMLGKVEDPALYERLRRDSGPDRGIPFTEHLRRLYPRAAGGGSKGGSTDPVGGP